MSSGTGQSSYKDSQSTDDVLPLRTHSDEEESLTESMMEVSSLEPSSDDDDGMSVISVDSD